LPDYYLSRRLNRSIIFKPSPLFDKEGILLALFKRYDFEQLMGLAGWDTLGGVDAYRALALDRFAEFADRLRSDLRDEFAAVAQEYYQQQLAVLTMDSERETATRPYDFTPSFSGLFSGGFFATQRSNQQKQQITPESSAQWQVDYQKTEYVTAALAGLARNGEQSDVEFGRRYIYHDEYDLRLEAVRIVSRFGTEADAADLVRIAKGTEGELKEIAARAALRVSEFTSDLVKDLIETGEDAITSVVVIELTGHEDKARMAALLEPYLYAENQIVRTSVMAFFSATLTREELEQLLDRYLSAATYYYDVVCCFDRALYSPPNLLAAFSRKMLQDLQRRTWTCGDLDSHRM
jgi:hypothetical protein